MILDEGMEVVEISIEHDPSITDIGFACLVGNCKEGE